MENLALVLEALKGDVHCVPWRILKTGSLGFVQENVKWEAYFSSLSLQFYLIY